MASSSTQVTTVNSTIPFPAEMRRLIYQHLFLGTVVTLFHNKSSRPSHHPIDIKAKHSKNSRAGVFLASKDSQLECKDIMYQLTTWQFRAHSRKILGSPRCGSFEAKRFKIVELAPGEDLGDFFPWRRLLPELRCLVLSSHFQDPLPLDEAPHLYDVAKLYHELRLFSFRVLSDGMGLLSDVNRRFKILCSLWCEYEPYTANEKEGSVESDGQANDEAEEEMPFEGTEAEEGVRWTSRWILDVDINAVTRHKENITVECYHTAEMHCAFLTGHGEDVAVSAERDQLVEFLQSRYDSGCRQDEELGILEAEDVQNDLDVGRSLAARSQENSGASHYANTSQRPAIKTPSHDLLSTYLLKLRTDCDWTELEAVHFRLAHQLISIKLVRTISTSTRKDRVPYSVLPNLNTRSWTCSLVVQPSRHVSQHSNGNLNTTTQPIPS